MSERSELRKPPSKLEIQRAHDILESCIIDDNIIFDDELARKMMLCSLNALCWVLGHPKGDQFIENLVRIESDLYNQGIVFKESKDSKNCE